MQNVSISFVDPSIFFNLLMNNAFTPPPFDDCLREAVNDSFKSALIINSYENILKTPLQQEGNKLKDNFEKWLVNFGPYLGSPEWNAEEFLALDTKFRDELKPLNKELALFFYALQKGVCTSRQLASLSASKVNAVILTTVRCGNGHLSAALSMQQFFAKQGLQVPVIDREKVSTITDSVSVRCSYDRMGRLRELIGGLGASRIYSTASHDWNDFPLAYTLGIEMRLVQTDYEMHQSVVREPSCPCKFCLSDSAFDSMNGSLVKVWIATKELDGNSQVVKNRIGEEKFTKCVESFGFPVRQSFVRETAAEKLEEIRKWLGIRPEERVVLLNHNGIDSSLMQDFLEQINEYQQGFVSPLYVVVICGNNKAAKLQLEEYLQKTSLHKQVRLKIEGYVNEDDLADYAKAACVYNKLPGLMVGKTGGSTTAENEAMGVYTLGIAEYAESGESEAVNLAHLKKLGLGQSLAAPKLFVGTLNAILGSPFPSSLPDPLDWRKKLVEELSQETGDKGEGFCEIN